MVPVAVRFVVKMFAVVIALDTNKLPVTVRLAPGLVDEPIATLPKAYDKGPPEVPDHWDPTKPTIFVV